MNQHAVTWHKSSHRPFQQSILLALGLTILLAFTIFRPLRASPLIFLLFWLVLTVMVYQVVSFQSDKWYKTFAVPIREANERIAKLLEEKGLPYQQQAGGFALTKTGIFIGVKSEEDPSLTLLTLSPVTKETALLIERLSERLDEAFLLKGL